MHGIDHILSSYNRIESNSSHASLFQPDPTRLLGLCWVDRAAIFILWIACDYRLTHFFKAAQIQHLFPAILFHLDFQIQLQIYHQFTKRRAMNNTKLATSLKSAHIFH